MPSLWKGNYKATLQAGFLVQQRIPTSNHCFIESDASRPIFCISMHVHHDTMHQQMQAQAPGAGATPQKVHKHPGCIHPPVSRPEFWFSMCPLHGPQPWPSGQTQFVPFICSHLHVSSWLEQLLSAPPMVLLSPVTHSFLDPVPSSAFLLHAIQEQPHTSPFVGVTFLSLFICGFYFAPLFSIHDI